MNYLAHLFLAGKNDGLILGALLEDYVSGGIENDKNKHFPPEIKLGLRLHRHIDSFTDSDKSISECKRLFYPEFGKYSPVILDVVFDHFLQKNWIVFTEENFDDFRQRIYNSLLNRYKEYQPEPLVRLVHSMTTHDWLKNYIHIWGVEKALSSLNRRVLNVDLTKATQVMTDNYDFINSIFLEFFKRLQDSCKANLEEWQIITEK